jgi:hypothetical protein
VARPYAKLKNAWSLARQTAGPSQEHSQAFLGIFNNINVNALLPAFCKNKEH